MQITTIKIKNFRSIWYKGQGSLFTLNLSPGINYLVGPNNCGKSNILRALDLAFNDDNGNIFDMKADSPSALAYSRPTIEINFLKNTNVSSEKTLFRFAEEYESSVEKTSNTKSYAARDELHWVIQYSNTGRDDSFAVAGVGGRRGAKPLIRKTLKQLRQACHFIYIPSGQSIEELFEGAFQNILKSVLEEHLYNELKAANKSRTEYLNKIKTELFGPLEEMLKTQLGYVINEIRQVEVIPEIPNIGEQIAYASLRITDHFASELKLKGTGVRNTALIALINYIRKHSRRSLVFAIEEPESFLHPGAQARLIKELEQIAERRDVTMLITTHSPFILSKKPISRFITVGKNNDGLTSILKQSNGENGLKDVIMPLFDDNITPILISKMSDFDPSKKGIILVEGETDWLYMKIACEKKNKLELIDDLQIIPCYGTGKLICKAVFLKSILPNEKNSKFPIFILLDYDENGKSARNTLTNSIFNFRKTSEVTTYKDFKNCQGTEIDVEAEDIFGSTILENFLSLHPAALAEKIVRGANLVHYGLNEGGKTIFTEYVKSLSVTYFDPWIKLIESVRQRMQI
ncbi:MAG: hypothetical protein C4524_10005 [Candidatus Zixiibacteriota bacterium]|nr:MAG: hypothetical protein C4524_10005 [candidate division Zixibacteria bacterium]